jgi:hypothetical protein
LTSNSCCARIEAAHPDPSERIWAIVADMHVAGMKRQADCNAAAGQSVARRFDFGDDLAQAVI